MAPMKISDWLETVEYDVVYDSAETKADFQARTGYTPPAWPEEPLAVGREHSTAVYVAKAVAGDRIVTYGIDIATTIEHEFILGRRPAAEHYIGRGRTHAAIVATLRAVGL